MDQPLGTFTHRYLPEHQITLQVRTLQPAADIPVLYRWMSMEYADKLAASNCPPEKLEESYTAMLQSDFSQPFMGLVNDIPVCQLDLFRTQMDVLSLYYNEHKGDFGLHILLTPLVIQDHAAALLRMYLEYFFRFPELQRIVTDSELGNDWLQSLFSRVGFSYLQEVRLPYKKAALLACTRESFQQAISRSHS